MAKRPSWKRLATVSVGIGLDSDGHMVMLTDEQRRTHTYLLGVSGAGKTMVLCSIALQDLLRGAPVAFIDLIGTGVPYLRSCWAVANLRAMTRERGLYPALNQRLQREREAFFAKPVIIDFDDPKSPHRFNPLEAVPGMTTAELAGAFVACMERMLGGKMSEMRQLSLNLLALASVLIDTGGATVADMIELCCMGTRTLEEFITRLERKHAEGRLNVPVRPDLIKIYFRSFFAQASGRERRELVASTLRALAILLGDPVAARFVSCAKGNLDIDEVMNHGRSLLVNIPPKNLQTQAAVSSMLVGRFNALAMRRSSEDAGNGKLPQVHLIIDEFQRIFTEEMAAEIAVLRNKGVSVILAHQSGSQPPFHIAEGRGMLESVRDNCSTHIYLRMGRKDSEDLSTPTYQPLGLKEKLRYEEVASSSSESSAESTQQTSSETTSRGKTKGRNRTYTDSLTRGRTKTHSSGEGGQVTQTQGRSSAQMKGSSTSNSLNEAQSSSHGASRSTGASWGTARSVGLGQSSSQSHGESQNWSASQNQGHVLGLEPGETSPGLILTRESLARSSGQSRGGSAQSSQSVSLSRSDALSDSEGESWSSGRSSSSSRSHSRGTSTGTSESRSETKSNSLARGRSWSQTDGESSSLGYGRSSGTGTSEGESQSEGQTKGRTKGRSLSKGRTLSRREVIERYSLTDEAIVRSYELQSLPNRTAIVLQRGGGQLQRTQVRSLDMPQQFCTKLGTLDGLADLQRLTTPPPAGPEPTLGVLERLRLEQGHLGPNEGENL